MKIRHFKPMMKKLIVTICALTTAFIGLNAQSYQPTTTWPYMYENFMEGTVRFVQGGEQDGKYNISLDGNALHFIEGDYVKAFPASRLFAVRIGDDIYQNIGGMMLKVIAKSDKAIVVEEFNIDFAALNATGGAYGSSSTSAGTTAFSSLEGIGGTRTNMNHMELKNNKDNGKELPLIKKNYIFVKGQKIFCTKKDVLALSVDRDAVKSFLKANKIKFNDPQSVLILGDFLYGLL